MDIAKKIWKDARLEKRFDTIDGVIKIHLYNLDSIEIERNDLSNRYEEMRSNMFKFRKIDEETYDKLQEIWKTKRVHEQSEKIDGPMMQLFFQILHGELLKYEKIVEKSISEMEEIIQKEEEKWKKT